MNKIHIEGAHMQTILGLSFAYIFTLLLSLMLYLVVVLTLFRNPK